MKEQYKSQKAGLIDEEIASISLSQAKKQEIIGGLEIKKIHVSPKDSLKFSVPYGSYVTVNALKGKRLLVKTCAKYLRELMCGKSVKTDKILVVGIGNPYMTTDCLGARVVERLMEKRPHNLLLFTPFLEGITGISSFVIIKSLVKVVKPTAIIVIDALAARSSERICTSYQFSNAGLTPGSAVGGRIRLDKKSLGVPVIAIGVPTVVNCRNLDGDGYSISLPDMLVCPKNIDELVDDVTSNLSEIILKGTE